MNDDVIYQFPNSEKNPLQSVFLFPVLASRSEPFYPDDVYWCGYADIDTDDLNIRSDTQLVRNVYGYGYADPAPYNIIFSIL